MNKKDLRIETMRGTGPGGQHKNKSDTACRITHIPTGITAYADERSQADSKRKAFRELRRRLRQNREEKKAADKKQRRDEAIKPNTAIRTYDFGRGLVTDHRTGKTGTIKNVLNKGKLGLLK